MGNQVELEFCSGNFDTFATHGDGSIVSHGKVFMEVEVKKIDHNRSDTQFGWIDGEWNGYMENNPDGIGVGDDGNGWAVDGCRNRKFHGGKDKTFLVGECVQKIGKKWGVGDTLGFAADLDQGRFFVGLNGVWSEVYGKDDFQPRGGIRPAFSACFGTFFVNLGHVPNGWNGQSMFKYTPPDPSFVSFAQAAGKVGGSGGGMPQAMGVPVTPTSGQVLPQQPQYGVHIAPSPATTMAIPGQPPVVVGAPPQNMQGSTMPLQGPRLTALAQGQPMMSQGQPAMPAQPVLIQQGQMMQQPQMVQTEPLYGGQPQMGQLQTQQPQVVQMQAQPLMSQSVSGPPIMS